MQWEHLTSADFARAARKTGVCVFPIGVVEKHGNHLPLGTDFLNAHAIACRAAEKEAAVVFPPFYFGQIYEARCFPGTITIKPTLLLEIIQGMFDEIGRNGFTKIIVHNGHGGNWDLLRFLAQCSLWEEKPYSVYVQTSWLDDTKKKEWEALLETPLHAHACECETSITLANFPELVKMARVPESPAEPLNRAQHLKNTKTGIGWYCNYPEHYAGDARPATRERGEALRQLIIDSLAEYIAAVKNDDVVPAMEQEFFQRVKKISGSSDNSKP